MSSLHPAVEQFYPTVETSLERTRGMYSAYRDNAVETPLKNGDQTLVDLHGVPFDRATNKHIKMEQELVAVVNAGDELFGLVRATDHERGDAAIMITRFADGVHRKRASIVGFVSARDQEVGRTMLLEDGHGNISPDMSRSHFTAKISSRGLHVGDSKSLNGTKVLENPSIALATAGQDIDTWCPKSATVKHEMTRTLHADPRTYWQLTARGREMHDGSDMYQGRQKIDRHSRIAEHVMFGIGGEEAIVVSPSRDPGYYQKLNKDLDKFMGDYDNMSDSQKALKVYQFVSQRMRYSLDEVKALNEKLGVPSGGKIELSAYMSAGLGVCRHQALMCGYLIERLIDERKMRGSVHINRNGNWSPDDQFAGHGWARYTDKDEKVYILDVAQHYFGELEKSLDREDGWNYFQDEEYEKFRLRRIGAKLVQRVP